MVNRPSIAKLVPPVPGRSILRPRVVARIRDALDGAGCCWIAAPAGYGKTTAAADYLRREEVPHAWYRVDEGDQDVASFFHYLALSGALAEDHGLPVFGAEYAEQPLMFARRFFRSYFAALPAGAVLVLDDVHDADTPGFRALLAVMLHERPGHIRCLILSRTLPPRELDRFLLAAQIVVIDHDVLQFSREEARALVEDRRGKGASAVPIERARGWAVGLVLLAERGVAPNLADPADPDAGGGESALFDMLGRQVFETLPAVEQDMLLKLSLTREITPALAVAMIGSDDAGVLLERLHQRQLLITRGDGSDRSIFRLHDLLRDFLLRSLEQRLTAPEQAQLRTRTAAALEEAGRFEEAVDLALQGALWPLARDLVVRHAETILAQGRRTTLIDWCACFPDDEYNAWLCYWRGVAHVPDDATAEIWLDRAWRLFERDRDDRGQRLTVARAVLVKTDSWRTHTGLSLWTRRAVALLEQPGPDLPAQEELLVMMGLLRALDFADDQRAAAPVGAKLARRLLARLAHPRGADTANLRLLASASVIEHAGSMGQAELFAQAVDAVGADLGDRTVSPWARGLWLVAFGSVSGRYFQYRRRGFPFANAEEALRAAIDLGEREALPGVEFGALYHLQYQMKLGNDLTGFAALIARLGQVADSRYTTQVAVLADCEAALHTMNGAIPEARVACGRIMAAIEAADEPPVERWPHFITEFQVGLADRDAAGAAAYLATLLPLFDGAMRERTVTCIRVAEALEAKWRMPDAYPARLEIAAAAMRSADWTVILANLPDLLADLLADALEQGFEPEFCRRLIQQRCLLPPPRHPSTWPWALKIHVLGRFHLERDGQVLSLGSKPAARSLDVLRALAVAKDHICALDNLHDWFWPDMDGDLAKAACEQAVHRLRKLLGRSDLIVQREGKLRLAANEVWVDLDDWEVRLQDALRSDSDAAGLAALDGIFDAFPGPLLAHERTGDWSVVASERLRRTVIDLAIYLGGRHAAVDDGARARAIYLRALDSYPDAARLHEALISSRMAQDDISGAWEDYARWAKVRPEQFDDRSSPALRALLEHAREADRFG